MHCKGYLAGINDSGGPTTGHIAIFVCAVHYIYTDDRVRLLYLTHCGALFMVGKRENIIP